jgi:hypothetical protein
MFDLDGVCPCIGVAQSGDTAFVNRYSERPFSAALRGEFRNL